ncbi:hypothetical protein GCM10011332_12750 [Terasakiella brassicae]|uniref:Thiamine pyrimidine synthase n=1 Tax=Terasakiella brassicae TaxID=1634917 RepID=A0A917BWU4_9PROT|nr:ABC transporter substrate-binding protein [Terasakiella brassicae]GGF60457.1 hypothetical protein GCM10011332_12750 [Terasakiella brassicae]
MHLKRAVVLLFIFVLQSATVHAYEKVSLKLQWLDQFQFAGYYMAKEKGFYRDRGLDVAIQPFTFENDDVVAQVLTGKATYGTGRSSLLATRVQGKPVVVLAAIFQDTPSILLTRKDTGIENISDLIGRKIMITPDELGAAATMGMLQQEGVRAFDIIRQKHSYNLDDLITGKTDAMASYISNEPFILKEKGIAFNSFAPKDYGQAYYGDLLFTSEREIRENPKRVKAFREASLMGWAYAFNHIEETVQVIKESYNGQKKSVESLLFEGHELRKLAYQNGVELGNVTADKFHQIAELYYEIGIFPEVYTFDGFIWQE